MDDHCDEHRDVFSRLSQPHSYKNCARCAKHREMAAGHYSRQRGPAGSIATAAKLRRSPPKLSVLKSTKFYATVDDFGADDDDNNHNVGLETNNNNFFIPSSPYKPMAVQPAEFRRDEFEDERAFNLANQPPLSTTATTITDIMTLPTTTAQSMSTSSSINESQSSQQKVCDSFFSSHCSETLHLQLLQRLADLEFELESERETSRSNIETLKHALHSTQQLFVGAESELESLRATLSKLQLERQQLGTTENFELDEARVTIDNYKQELKVESEVRKQVAIDLKAKLHEKQTLASAQAIQSLALARAELKECQVRDSSNSLSIFDTPLVNEFEQEYAAKCLAARDEALRQCEALQRDADSARAALVESAASSSMAMAMSSSHAGVDPDSMIDRRMLLVRVQADLQQQRFCT